MYQYTSDLESLQLSAYFIRILETKKKIEIAQNNPVNDR